jgi:hypothetical protein
VGSRGEGQKRKANPRKMSCKSRANYKFNPQIINVLDMQWNSLDGGLAHCKTYISDDKKQNLKGCTT